MVSSLLFRAPARGVAGARAREGAGGSRSRPARGGRGAPGPGARSLFSASRASLARNAGTGERGRASRENTEESFN